MAGERWTQVRTLLESLSNYNLQTPAQDWTRLRNVMQRVTLAQSDPDISLQQAGAVMVASRYLIEDAQKAYEAVTGMSNMSDGPARILEHLAMDIRMLSLQMEREEQGGPFGFNARPDPAAKPVMPAMQIAHDQLLYDYDQQAEVYMMRLRETVALAVDRLDRSVPANWPKGVPRADPEAPPG